MKKLHLSASFTRFLKKLNPVPPVGGLSVGDTALRFLLLEEGSITKHVSLRLPEGIIERGRVKDRVAFGAALRELRGLIAKGRTPLHIIFSLPPGLVYVQPFSLPVLQDEKLAEAAMLNLQMISPLDFNLAYAGYERLGENALGIDMLGVFVEKEIVNEFSEVLEETGFAIAAIEFPALAVARLSRYDNVLEGERAYIMANIEIDGLSLMILRKFGLYFHHFQSWDEVREESGGGELDKDMLVSHVRREIHKLMNFYGTRWGGSISEVVLASGELGAGFENNLASDIGIPVRSLSVPDFAVPGPGWFPVLGSALRGVVPRSEDVSVSLTDAPVDIQYREARIRHFVTLWRRVAVTVSVFILLLFVVADSFLARTNASMQTAMNTGTSVAEINEARTLEEKAKEFNGLVKLFELTKPTGPNWDIAIQHILFLAGPDIHFERMHWVGYGVTMDGIAESNDAVIAFKRKLTEDPTLEKVFLPITEVKDNPDGTVSFTTTFNVKS